MPEQNNIKLWIHDLFASIDSKNTETFTDFLTDNVQFRCGNMPISQGKASVKEQVSYFLDSIKSLQHTITEFWIQNDSVICHGSVNYIRHNDSALMVPFCNIFKTSQYGIYEYLIFFRHFRFVSIIYYP